MPRSRLNVLKCKVDVTDKVRLTCFVVFYLCSTIVFADVNVSNVGPITFSVVVKGERYASELTWVKLVKINSENPPTEDIQFDNYKIDRWVYAGLQDLGLEFTFESVVVSGERETKVTCIGGLRNTSSSSWVYYVNGVRSKYQINTQLDSGVKSITYKYEKTD